MSYSAYNHVTAGKMRGRRSGFKSMFAVRSGVKRYFKKASAKVVRHEHIVMGDTLTVAQSSDLGTHVLITHKGGVVAAVDCRPESVVRSDKLIDSDIPIGHTIPSAHALVKFESELSKASCMVAELSEFATGELKNMLVRIGAKS